LKIKNLAFWLFLGLLLWGGYSFLTYLGAPGHLTFVTSPDVQKSVEDTCGDSALLCRGIASFAGFISFGIGNLFGFFWYIFISLAVYGIILEINWLKKKKREITFKLKPWHVFAFFVTSLWLLFTITTFNIRSNTGVTVTLFQPQPTQNTSFNPTQISSINSNLASLQERGCLSEDGTTYSEMCTQFGFVKNVLSQLVVVTLFILELLILGSGIINLVKFKVEGKILESAVSLGAGICAMVLILWSIAVFGSLNTPICWGLFVLIPAVFYKQTLYWLKSFVKSSMTVELKWNSLTLILAWLLISYIALNFAATIRPFPIGWDDSLSYVNRPHLLYSYGHIIPGMSSFQWEYLTSLGFFLFGNNPFGTTAALMINFLAGVFACFLIFVFTSEFLEKGRGLFASIIYYSMPMVCYFSFLDMKIDNAVFAMNILTFLTLFIFLFKPNQDTEKRSWKWLIISAIFCAFSFGFKYTSVMAFVTLGVVLFGALWSGWAAAGFMIMGVVLYQKEGALNLGNVLQKITGSASSISLTGPIIALAVAAVVLFGISVLRQRGKAVYAIKSFAIFTGVFVLFVVPWVIRSNLQYAHPFSGVILEAPNTLAPEMVLDNRVPVMDYPHPIRSLPPALQVDTKSPECQTAAAAIELGRYQGPISGVLSYIALPWATVMNFNLAKFHVFTTAALLLFPLILLLPFFWKKENRWLRWLCLATTVWIIQWVFLADGVIWYGLGLFLGLTVALEVLVVKAPNKKTFAAASTLIWLAIFFALVIRADLIDFTGYLFYPMGIANAETSYQLGFGPFAQVAKDISARHESMPDRPYLYQIATDINYQIPKNIEVVGASDPQLDFFSCIYRERNPELTVARLKALGFNSIVIDTNLATIEDNPNGILHQRDNMLNDFLTQNPKLLKIVVDAPKNGVRYVQII